MKQFAVDEHVGHGPRRQQLLANLECVVTAPRKIAAVHVDDRALGAVGHDDSKSVSQRPMLQQLTVPGDAARYRKGVRSGDLHCESQCSMHLLHPLVGQFRDETGQT